MNNQAKSLLDNEEVSSIINTKHQDVFSVLGMHKLLTEKGVVVRAFLPEASRVEVIDSKTNVKTCIG